MYLHQHNSNWKNQFNQQKKRLISLAQIQLSIHHIGSTAVVGLSAKNCIDMLGVVEDIKTVNSLSLPISQLGYESRGAYGIAGRRYFSKPTGPKCHLHVFGQGDPNIEKHLTYVGVITAVRN